MGWQQQVSTTQECCCVHALSASCTPCMPGLTYLTLQVFTLDWDKQYLEDEATLREAGGYDANDIQLLDPLPPGAALWPDLPPPPAPPANGPQPVPPEAEADASAILGEPAFVAHYVQRCLRSWLYAQ
jgi:hypothetical protein